MAITLSFHSSVPNSEHQRLNSLINLVNGSGLYGSRSRIVDLTFDEPIGLPPALRKNQDLSGFTSASRHVYLNPLFAGDRPLEDRFLHELMHVLEPGIAAGGAIGTHPLAFYERERRLYNAIGRPFDIHDSFYETDSQVYARLINPSSALASAPAAGRAQPFSIETEAAANKRRPICLHDSSAGSHLQQVRALLFLGVISLGAAAVLWVYKEQRLAGR